LITLDHYFNYNQNPAYLYPYRDLVPDVIREYDPLSGDTHRCINKWVATHRAIWFAHQGAFAVVFTLYRKLRIVFSVDDDTATIEPQETIGITQTLDNENQEALPLVIRPRDLELPIPRYRNRLLIPDCPSYWLY